MLGIWMVKRKGFVLNGQEILLFWFKMCFCLHFRKSMAVIFYHALIHFLFQNLTNLEITHKSSKQTKNNNNCFPLRTSVHLLALMVKFTYMYMYTAAPLMHDL